METFPVLAQRKRPGDADRTTLAGAPRLASQPGGVRVPIELAASLAAYQEAT